MHQEVVSKMSPISIFVRECSFSLSFSHKYRTFSKSDIESKFIFLEEAIIKGVLVSDPLGGLWEPSIILLQMDFNLTQFHLSGKSNGSCHTRLKCSTIYHNYPPNSVPLPQLFEIKADFMQTYSPPVLSRCFLAT